MLTGEGNPFAHFFPSLADFCRQVLHSGPIAPPISGAMTPTSGAATRTARTKRVSAGDLR